MKQADADHAEIALDQFRHPHEAVVQLLFDLAFIATQHRVVEQAQTQLLVLLQGYASLFEPLFEIVKQHRPAL